MTSPATIRFILDGELIEIENPEPTRTVLQYLREDLRRKGSKEGCAEGDCGACTVVLAEVQNGSRKLKAINSCIQFLPTLDGKELITVESLGADGKLHPVQQAMLEHHGSQCGFCTPGFIMSLYALYESNPTPGRAEIDDALAGNLCRCTGYRPIIAAAKAMSTYARPAVRKSNVALQDLSRESSLHINHAGQQFFAPRSTEELVNVLAQYPDATILAGGTDIGLWVTKQHRELGNIVYTGRVTELAAANVTSSSIEVGAAAPLTDVVPLIVEHYPGLDEMFRRFASPPIRNAGTLGGNIANGSPIGDSMAALLVLDTALTLVSKSGERQIALTDFYHDYMVNDLQPGEVVARIDIPLPANAATVTSHKWSKRFDQDISAVCNAYRLELLDGHVRSFKMACGGLAATVKRASATETVLNGAAWEAASIELACDALAQDFAPISDMRASAEIRLHVAQNLLRRFFAETNDSELATVYNYGR